MYFSSNLDEISNIIKKGGVALLQVDTIFGLICNGADDDAIKKIENIKNRNKPAFGFFVKDISVACKYVKFNQIQEDCFNKVFPGYFTLILEANDNAIKSIPQRALGEKIVNNIKIKTMGLRVPKNDFCLKLLEYFDYPLVATSANISGQNTATKFEEINENIIEQADVVYYNNQVPIAGLSSTIVDITDVDNSKIIRNGSGDINLLKDFLLFK